MYVVHILISTKCIAYNYVKLYCTIGLGGYQPTFTYTANNPKSHAYNAANQDLGSVCNFIITDFQYQLNNFANAQTQPVCPSIDARVTGNTELITADRAVIAAHDLSAGMSIPVSDNQYETVQYISKHHGSMDIYVYGINGMSPTTTKQHPIQIVTTAAEC